MFPQPKRSEFPIVRLPAEYAAEAREDGFMPVCIWEDCVNSAISAPLNMEGRQLMVQGVTEDVAIGILMEHLARVHGVTEPSKPLKHHGYLLRAPGNPVWRDVPPAD